MSLNWQLTPVIEANELSTVFCYLKKSLPLIEWVKVVFLSSTEKAVSINASYSTASYG